jgi:beta-lactamase class A
MAERAEKTSTGKLAACLLDVQSGETWEYNADARRPAASIIKVPILIELFARAELGLLKLTETVLLRRKDKVGGAGVLLELHEGLPLTLRDLGILMTVVSDNTASNMLIDRLGMAEINERMQRIGMPDSVLGRKFMIDPNALHAKNFTTARDMSRCLARLLKGDLLGPQTSHEVVEILRRQQYREKIPLLLPEDVPVAHKTGEISGTRHDAALVLLPRHPYALTCMTWDLQDVLAADRAIAELSKEIYEVMIAMPAVTAR